ASVLRKAFIEAANTPKETAEVVRQQKRIESILAEIRHCRRQQLLTRAQKNYASLRKTFASKDDILANAPHLSAVYGQNTLQKISDNMIFYYNTLLDLKGVEGFAHTWMENILGVVVNDLKPSN